MLAHAGGADGVLEELDRDVEGFIDADVTVEVAVRVESDVLVE